MMPAVNDAPPGLSARRLKPIRGGTWSTLLVIAAVIAASAVMLELGARAFVYAFDWWVPDERINADAYAGAPWTRDYYREFRASGDVEWHSYVYWRRRPYVGTSIHIDKDGIRQTWTPAAAPERRIFVMGGSTVWGTGARDDQTLPSHIARELDASGDPVHVVNYGESGYVTEQSVAMLLERLRASDVPDVVVFYVGAEDVFAAYQNGRAGVPQNEANRALEFNAMQPEALGSALRVMTSGMERVNTLFHRPAPVASPSVSADVLANAIEVHACQNRKIVSGLAHQFGFTPVWFLQPVIFSKPQLTSYEQLERGRYESAREIFDRAYARLRRSDACDATPLHDLSLQFADERAPVFLDAFHISEDGNHRVARAMLPYLTRVLSDRVRHR